MYTKEQFAKLMDSTLLKPTATHDNIIRLCEEAKGYHFATVMVLPFWLPIVRRELQESDVKPATVIGFPFGGSGRAVKVFEARTAITHGAKELDVVINIGALKSGERNIVEGEVSELIDTARMTGMTQDAKRTVLKFIIECYYLTDEEKTTACEIIRDAGGDFIKTSTGTAPGGATVEDIRLIRRIVGPDIGVKAAGGIRTTEQAMSMLDAGASRIGASNAAAIVEGYVPEDYLESAGRKKQ
ncbi:MAG: deoxyribose-phosphate aldolase [Armatimonadetes bacterium]|jgi:deoxyribose-phosphate aldolase|nr:deoxyribose-phosphate aldolase [Armatimonadota bacterium]